MNVMTALTPLDLSLAADELSQASLINERLARIGHDLHYLLRDTQRLTDESPTARDVLAPTIFFLSSAAEAAVDAHRLAGENLRFARKDLLDSADHLQTQAPAMRGE
jgi:hypothetical protein